MAFLSIILIMAILVPIALAACVVTSDVGTVIVVTAVGTPLALLTLILVWRWLNWRQTKPENRARDAWMQVPGTAQPAVGDPASNPLLDAWILLRDEVKGRGSIARDGAP